ncbi:hypothetical protein [Singulisphaera acidiphila]|uniref:DhnA-type fructose-1,6-bisphosphate aldolase-like enzyme n=1 Tax=Singulisphaera acidiphila (strain ATCC BAA-1392 / DSM 18658 / VKM B-2454 / MOB10) TaxID=886293 RepID=L0D9R3_SINAD|nr:hypothetical protein [Singulisphaera acidiphila]AGA26134.1 hypothetical protein Sinac_1763 [Singulisphaera acidiphila DSM 18658]
MDKSLDRKLAAIHANPNCREFILADAKDADMAFGIGAPGLSPEAHSGELRLRTLEEYREQMRLITRQGLVDIMLMSASSNYALTIRERLFENSHVTPAIRANDTTDVHLARGASYTESPSRPFRSASLDHAQCGHLDCAPEERTLGANLGLYSVTFNNDLSHDTATLERFHEFRVEAERKGFRYFLEVFDPNIANAVAPEVLPGYINDMIARMLAGVAPAGRPVFLKMVYHGPKAMEELFRYDPHLVIGILGGSAGTTFDAFQLLADAQKHGAKVALFGRKINSAENQLAFVQFLRLIVDGVINPTDAVKAYHAVLGKLGIRPHRPLEEDLKAQATTMSYGGTSTSVVVPAKPEPAPPAPTPAVAVAPAKEAHACQCHSHHHAPEPVPATRAAEPAPHSISNGQASSNGFPTFSDGLPDFSRMDVVQRLAYHRQRLGLGR